MRKHAVAVGLLGMLMASAPAGMSVGAQTPGPSSAPSAAASPAPGPSGAASPASSPSDAPSPASPSPHLPPLKVTKLWAGDEAGFPRKVFYSVEPAVWFYALVAPRTAVRKGTTSATDRSFTMLVRDALGHEVGRLGGALPVTLDWAHADLPRDCAEQSSNGLAIAETPLAHKPGKYHAVAFLDGVPAGDLWFTIKPLKTDGEVVITSAAVEDAQGGRRFTFTARDRGVYAHLTLVNKTRTQPHEHLVQVAFIGPSGQVGRSLGGPLHLDKGARLDGRDFPVVNDAEHADGLLIDGTPLAKMIGPWRMVVYIDGRAVREVPFRIIP